jgi:DNA-binding Lrp family transcriptional regulator
MAAGQPLAGLAGWAVTSSVGCTYGYSRLAAPAIPERRAKMRAYVLINVRAGKVRDVVAAVSQLEGVQHADACWGLPDVFAYVDTSNEKDLNQLVVDQIQKLDGVERTETHIVVG